MKIFDFYDQNDIGTFWQKQVLKRCQFPLVQNNKIDVTDIDFKLEDEEFTLELKTDTYCPIGETLIHENHSGYTVNFFIERYSKLETKADGGPWQALNKNAKFYMYLFFPAEVYYVFEVKKLILRMEDIIEKNLVVSRTIKNKTYNTFGYITKIDLLKDIAVKDYLIKGNS